MVGKYMAMFVSAAIGAACMSTSALPADCVAYRQCEVDAAVKQLSSDDRWDRKAAAYRLSEMGKDAKSAVPRLVAVLKSDPSNDVRGECCNALGKIGAQANSAVPAIIAFLRDSEGGYERAYAATALGQIRAQPEECVAVLTEALKTDAEPVVRQLAARALGEFGSQADSAVPVLVDAIKSGNKDMRDAACDALKQIPPRGSDIDAVKQLLNDEIAAVRDAATVSLKRAEIEQAAGATEQR